jgi:hypothetical protein
MPLQGHSVSWLRAGEEQSIRQIVFAASIVWVGLAVPRTVLAAPNLALPHSDYPGKSQVAVLPATNHVADKYFGPVHRSSFNALHRVDGAGWVQAAVWHFTTGRGGAKRTHPTVFAYAINVYHSRKQAQNAVANVKIKTVAHRVSRIYSRLYRHSDGKETLVFLFFSLKSVEVESYYEYTGTAPTATAASLRKLFNRQASHLAAVARKLHRSIANPPPPPLSTVPPTPEATATPDEVSPTETPTATATIPADTPTATAVPPTETPLPSPTPTETPVPSFTITASSSSPAYTPGTKASVAVQVKLGDSPVSGVDISMTFEIPGSAAFCNATTDSTGSASCSVLIPPGTPDNSQVDVFVSARDGSGRTAETTVSFLVS